MKEPIVLGLDADATDEALEERARDIRLRVQAFVVDLQKLSRKHNIWLTGVEETPSLFDRATDEACGNLDWNDKSSYEASFNYDVSDPVQYRQSQIKRMEERRIAQERHEKERQERIEQMRRQDEHAERMKAAGYQRIEPFVFHPMGRNDEPFRFSGTVLLPGTAGGWYNPTTGHVYTGGSPDPGEYKPEGGKP